MTHCARLVIPCEVHYLHRIYCGLNTSLEHSLKGSQIKLKLQQLPDGCSNKICYKSSNFHTITQRTTPPLRLPLQNNNP